MPAPTGHHFVFVTSRPIQQCSGSGRHGDLLRTFQATARSQARERGRVWHPAHCGCRISTSSCWWLAKMMWENSHPRYMKGLFMCILGLQHSEASATASAEASATSVQAEERWEHVQNRETSTSFKKTPSFFCVRPNENFQSCSCNYIHAVYWWYLMRSFHLLRWNKDASFTYLRKVLFFPYFFAVALANHPSLSCSFVLKQPVPH